MQMLPLQRLLITLIIFTPNIQCQVLTMKCCKYGEKLNANLTTCQPINASDIVSVQNAKFGNVDFGADVGSEIVIRRKWENNSDISWLPEGLKFSVGSDRVDVVIGRPNMCPNAKTLRLQLPRDNHRIDWLTNGSLLLNSSSAHGNIHAHLFTPQHFCSDSYVDNNGTRQSAILICGACDHVRCVKKCCPMGKAVVCVKVLSSFKCECKSYNAPWSPFHPHIPLPNEDIPYEVVIDQNITCKEGYYSTYNKFIGRPPYMIQRFWEKYRKEGEMCAETIVGLWGEPAMGMRRCMRKPPFNQVLDNWLHLPEAVILAVAVITLLVVPREKISTYSYVHDMSLFWHAACLFARSLLWTVYLVAWWACFITPIFVYFFSIGATLWLNVLCINMVCGFWKPPGRPSGRKANAGYSPMFLWYSLYAWGATVAMTSFSSFMWFSLAAPSALLRPTLFETRTCFIEEEGDGKIATFAYYYGPVSWLLLMNAALFVATAARVRYLRSSGGLLKGKESASSSFRNSWSVVIYIKLLWLMGVVEMAMEMVAWASNDHIYYTAVAVTGLDVLRAVAVFVFCCCNRRTARFLRERVCCACSAMRLRKRCAAAAGPPGACAEVLKTWAARVRERVGRVPRCCPRRPAMEIEPPFVEGKYTPAGGDGICRM